MAEQVLNEDQQRQLNQRKVELRIENERYLQNHPELGLMLKHFCEHVMEHKPLSNKLVPLAKAFFTDVDLNQKIVL